MNCEAFPDRVRHKRRQRRAGHQSKNPGDILAAKRFHHGVGGRLGVSNARRGLIAHGFFELMNRSVT